MYHALAQHVDQYVAAYNKYWKSLKNWQPPINRFWNTRWSISINFHWGFLTASLNFQNITSRLSIEKAPDIDSTSWSATLKIARKWWMLHEFYFNVPYGFSRFHSHHLYSFITITIHYIPVSGADFLREFCSSISASQNLAAAKKSNGATKIVV